MNSTKVAGWLLLILGLAVIAYGLYSSWQIFTAQKPVPEIFKVPQTQSQPRAQGGSFSLDAQLGNILGTQIKQMVPDNTVPQLLNLLSWSVLAGVFIFGGSQISGLGIKLLK